MRPFVPVVILAVALIFVAVRLRQRGRIGGIASLLARRRASGAAAERPPVLGATGLVAGREIRQRVRGRIFRVATVLLLLGVAAAVVIPAATKGKSQAVQVGVVGEAPPSLGPAITVAAARVGTDVQVVSETDAASGEDALQSGHVDVVVVDGERLVVKHEPSSGDTSQTTTFVHALAQILGANQAMQAAGLTPSQQAKLAGATPLPISALHPARATTPARTTAVIGLIILTVMLTQYLTWTLIGVMEEKSSRVVEVLLAAVRPLQLLAGKVIGIGVVVFAQAAVVAAFALVLGRAVGSDLLRGSAPLVLLSTLVWLLLGYAFYSWLYAAAGSMAERQDQVQSLAIPLAAPIIAAYVLSITVLGSGNPPPTYLKVLAYLPPTAPFAMTTLVGLGAVTWWQFTLSVLLTAASVVVVASFAATVYRRAILRTGRRVRLREVFADRAAQRVG
jgi:ABC-2 type transport system permease protein